MKAKKKALITKAVVTTVRLYVPDTENVAAIVRSGASSDLASAVRLGLALARRWVESGGS